MLRYHFSYHLSSYILPQYLICGIFPDGAHSNVLVAFGSLNILAYTKSLIWRGLLCYNAQLYGVPDTAFCWHTALFATWHPLCTAHPKSGHGPESRLSHGLLSQRKRWVHPRKPLPEKQQKFGILHLCRQQDKVKGSRKLSSLLLRYHNFPVFKGVPNGTTGLTACALASLGSALGFYFWVWRPNFRGR